MVQITLDSLDLCESRCESVQKFLLRFAFAKSRVSILPVIARALPEAIHESKIDCHENPTDFLAMTNPPLCHTEPLGEVSI